MNSLEPVFVQARETAGLFRLGRDVEAALAMIELFDPVQSRVDGAGAAIQQQWADLLGAMLGCQEAQDWLGLADYLEYELLEWLQAIFAG
ncbi:hypothetical protein J4P02_08630 [Pseudomonas sp. NFXW11]|uniref:hypothetical protein n=1 Tax=Pseudomonas sp. NFXW11 TaxID=2819531 RepID=UPI003CEF1F9B